MRPILFTGIILTFILISCTKLPVQSSFRYEKIVVGYGPEDIVIDSISTLEPRLLVSCGNRREIYNDSADGFYAIDLSSEKVTRLTRKNEPAGLVFHPHGFDAEVVDGVPYLYVINHDDANSKQSVLRYFITQNEAILDSVFNHPLLISPNDIFVCPDGSFFISNDAGKRGNIWELILRQRKSSVVYFPVNESPVMVDDNLRYANGLFFSHDMFYVTNVLDKEIPGYKKNGTAFEKTVVSAEGFKGSDNINPYKSGLLIAIHPRFFKFFQHAKNPLKPSPTLVKYFDLMSGKSEVIFFDSGKAISTGSTAIIFNNKLYIAQVFENFILSVDLKSNPQ